MTEVTERSMTLQLVKDAMGNEAEEFIAVMNVIQDIIDHPERYHGPAAIKYATLLAAYRTKISLKAQWYKTSGDKSIEARRKKDTLMSMYASLEENINTLKLSGRLDAKSAGVL